LLFAVAFLLFAMNQAILGLNFAQLEEQSHAYLLRLAGFGLIIAGIVSTNFGRQR
jgi:hydrogenase/urease accessory protein HupE